MSVRCKFWCSGKKMNQHTNKIRTEDGYIDVPDAPTYDISFSAVTSGSEENGQYWKWNTYWYS